MTKSVVLRVSTVNIFTLSLTFDLKLTKGAKWCIDASRDV